MNSVRDRSERLVEQLIAIPNGRRAIDVAWRARGVGNDVEGNTLAPQRTGDPDETGAQYALAHTASVVAGFPHRRHRFGSSAERNSSSGITRIVAFVSSLMRASHCASPHQPA